MRSALCWLVYVALGAIHKLFRPHRVVSMNGGFYFMTRDSVWYVGPDGQQRRISETIK